MVKLVDKKALTVAVSFFKLGWSFMECKLDGEGKEVSNSESLQHARYAQLLPRCYVKIKYDCETTKQPLRISQSRT